MEFLQALTLGLSLYFTTTMIHNWVLIHSSLKIKLGEGTMVYRNITGRLASLFWALFYLSCQF
jgi:hypothetical protein